ncbi:MAG: hypothetical protein ACE5RJ_02665 [Nitrosopumilaceae archaeon]
MNLYDLVTVRCAKCEKPIGEIDYDAQVIRPLCGKCANPLPEGDKILYTVSHYQKIPRKQELLQVI